MQPRIQPSSAQDRVALLRILEQSSQFDADALEHVLSCFDAYLADPDQELWFSAQHVDGCVGVAYCRPEPVTSGTWNLLMIWVQEGYQGQGHGSALMEALLKELRDRQARLVIVETSQGNEFAAARNFYLQRGFQLEAEIQDFFDAGADKLIYTRKLTEEVPHSGSQHEG